MGARGHCIRHAPGDADACAPASVAIDDRVAQQGLRQRAVEDRRQVPPRAPRSRLGDRSCRRRRAATNQRPGLRPPPSNPPPAVAGGTSAGWAAAEADMPGGTSWAVILDSGSAAGWLGGANGG